MAPRKSTGVPVEEEEESEWEYEYYETETEDFYVTLDLSSHTRQFVQGIKQLSKSHADPTTKLPASTIPPPANAPSHPSATPPPSQVGGTAQADAIPSSNQGRLPDPASDSSEKQKRIQITDLHTFNPLISYNSQLYSCDWTTIIGTDMLFATAPSNIATEATSSPPASPPPSPQPAPRNSSSPRTNAKSTASLIGTTRIKLSAHPVHVFARPSDSLSWDPTMQQEEGVADGIDSHHAQSTTLPPETSASPLIPLAPNASLDRQNQGAFLNRLIEIKREKGETDEVLVYSGSRDFRRGGGGGAAEKDQDGGNLGIREREGKEVEEVEMLDV